MYYNENSIMLEKGSEYLDTYRAHSSRFNELYAPLLERVYRKEYSKGGECLTRGFYCPSPTLDIVAGGCSRGRLYKRTPKDGNNDYEYTFDERGQLLFVNTYSSEAKRVCSTELLISADGVVLGLLYRLDFQLKSTLSVIEKCQYENGRIVSYEKALCSYLIKGGKPVHSCLEACIEHYKYGNGLLSSTIMDEYHYTINKWQRNEYWFTYDDEGRFASTIHMLDAETDLGQNKRKSRTFEVSRKRGELNLEARLKMDELLWD